VPNLGGNRAGRTEEESPVFEDAADRVVVHWRTAADRGSAVGTWESGENTQRAQSGSQAVAAFQDSAEHRTRLRHAARCRW
jgi:hypothetical protein